MVSLRWRDPWPSPQVAWADPPWHLGGRVVTAWFEAPRAFVEGIMSPDLWPGHTPTVRARLRFYDIAFKAPAGSAGSPVEGRFREAVVAFRARAGGLEGEVSLFMWTDSDAYMLWGREVFGWPLIRGRIDLGGSLWDSRTPASGAAGTAMLSAPGGQATLVVDELGHGQASAPGPACWITPRRVLHRAGLDAETREVLLVRPVVREAGVRYAATGRASLDFDRSHPLHGLRIDAATYEVVDGFHLVVGADVDLA